MKLFSIFKSRLFTHSPILLLHCITYRCNCKCKFCGRWKKVSNYKNELSTKEIFKMLKDAKEAGMIKYVVEGGEPLLFKDLPNIMEYAKKLDFETIIITNGFYLKDRYKEIMPFIDSFIISIDSHDKLHDEMRVCDGLLKRTVEGIKLLKNNNKNVMINSILCKLNINKIDGLVNLSEELQIPIIFQPLDIFKGYNDHLKPTQSEIKKTFLKIIKYKQLGYKILNSNFYLKNIVENNNYACHYPKWFIYLMPNGNIVSCCDKIDKIWGDVKTTSFKKIYKSNEFREFNIKCEECSDCNSNIVIETSLLYSLNPKFLKNINDIIRLFNPHWGFNYSNSTI